MASIAPEHNLPSELSDRLFRALYGDPAAREAALASLRGEHPSHATAVDAHVREFELQRRAFDPESVPERFGPYLIHNKLGEGAHGRVLLAEEPAPVQRRVALKVFRPLPRLAERFRAELHAVASLNHDNIAKVFAAGEHEGEPYLVLELIETARSIGRFCRERHLALTERLQLFRQACHAVQHAHERGVLHLDLKPDNILVSEQEGRTVLKIVDFGQARVLAAGKAGSHVGTAPYMASEQLEGGAVDARADVHALGVTLYEILADRRPHEEDELKTAVTTAQLRSLYLRQVPPPSVRLQNFLRAGGSSSIRPRHLRGDLDSIVRKASARHVDERYATARDLAEDLRRFLDHRPVLAREATLTYILAKAARRWRRPLAASAAALLLGGAGFVYWYEKPVRPVTIEPFRIGADLVPQIQPAEVQPGDTLGVVVDLPRRALVAAVSLSTLEDNSVVVNYTEPNLRADLGNLRRDVVLPLPAGRHEVFLCHADQRSNATSGWREGVWVFVLENEDTAPHLQQWLERLRTTIQAQAIRSPIERDTALALLRGVFDDDTLRGGPLDELPEARRRALADAFHRWSGDGEAWPLPSPRPQVYWWSVRTGSEGR